MEHTYSTPRKLSDLADVVKTRTPIFSDDRHGGDIRIKLDTDVNNHEWYVVTDDSQYGTHFVGMVNCWAFPHFNGAHDFYRYIPVKFCFCTFAEVLLAYPDFAESPRWIYEEEEYATRQFQWEQERVRQIDNAVIDAYRQRTGILEVSLDHPF